MAKFRLIILFLAVVFVAGCGQKNMPVSEKFWESHSKKIGIGIVRMPDGGDLYKGGSQGLLDMVINDAMASSETKYMKSMKADSFKEVIDFFRDELISQGYSTYVCPKEIVLEDMPKCSGKDVYKYDLSDYLHSNDCDYFILIQLKNYGASRSYYGFIPLSDPCGIASVHGAMVDRDNNLAWYNMSPGYNNVIQVDGKWNQPPEYPNLTVAVNKALKKAEYLLVDDFFAERLSTEMKNEIDSSGLLPDKKTKTKSKTKVVRR